MKWSHSFGISSKENLADEMEKGMGNGKYRALYRVVAHRVREAAY